MTAGAGTPARRARPIGSLLIANRGEIAARIARTARALGIRCIGLAAGPVDPWGEFDVIVRVPSYLAGEAILAAAAEAGADAIHPGYGFLAENGAFARAVEAAGIAWVGPPAAAIEAMGDKAAARRRAAALGVPVLPGYDGRDQGRDALVAAAEATGWPLLVKPAAGGGGKGMRVVRGAEELEESLAAARREAERAFGDDRLILERYVDRSRHVEIQVLFDAHGRGAHLGERDCSVQRRQQKVAEEAPAPGVGPALRAEMGAAALRLAADAGYRGAGTVEFLLDEEGRFHFLEMNTRLQVEHPVTEAVTGRDLVADQLRIAAGEPLGIEPGGGEPLGHAIEVRLYAEDPEAGFLPATGRVAALRWPSGVRVDAGIGLGERITGAYDPMLGKIVTHGADRPEALARLSAALDETAVLGVRTNLRFLRWLVREPFFRDGRARTDSVAASWRPEPIDPPEAAWEAAAGLLAAGLPPDGWHDGWRLNAPARIRVRHADRERSAPPGEPRSGPLAVPLEDQTVAVDVDGQSLEFALAAAPEVDEAARQASGVGEAASVVVAPMPGRVIAVRAAAGTPVALHDPIVILEAMKMENAVVATVPGTLATVHVAVGQQVQRGEPLAEIVP